MSTAQLFAALILGVVLFQLVTGTALGGRRQVSVTRQDHPGTYWTRIVFQVAVGGVVLATGTTSARWRLVHSDGGSSWHWVRIGGSRPDSSAGQATTTSATTAAPETESPTQRRRNEAFALDRGGNYAAAIAVYDELLQRSEADPKLHFFRGLAHWRLTHPDSALADFRRTMELEPTNFDAHQYADRILSQRGRWNEIVTIWDHYLATTPSSAEAYFERGGTNFHKGDRRAAQSDAAMACKLGKAEACSLAERLKH